jgi:predicted Fe-Mo cluster-binding NifX family protein
MCEEHVASGFLSVLCGKEQRMSYKMAIATSDGVQIDRNFRDAQEFLIVNVQDDGTYEFGAVRKFEPEAESDETYPEHPGCGSGRGCGGENSPKLKLVEDCRCMICTRIGFKIHKQMEKKAINTFEQEGEIGEILAKIIEYYDRVDNHKSLRDFAKNQHEL